MTLAKTKITVELNDGTTHDLVIGNPSLVAWDRARAQMKWPAIDEAPFLWMTWVSWHHMKSTGLIPPQTKYEEFEEKLCMAVGDTETPEGAEPDDAVDPTETSPALDSASP